MDAEPGGIGVSYHHLWYMMPVDWSESWGRREERRIVSQRKAARNQGGGLETCAHCFALPLMQRRPLSAMVVYGGGAG